MTEKKFKFKPGNGLPMGVSKVAEGVQFSMYLPENKECYLKLYRTGRKKASYRIPFTKEYRFGNVNSMIVQFAGSRKKEEGTVPSVSLSEVLTNTFEYTYEIDGVESIDPYASGVTGRNRWNHRGSEPLRGRICLDGFDWGKDEHPDLPYEDMILYQLHVRGFTKHSSSGVEGRGTYYGIQQKIPYLKDLGVNAVMLLPAYEFEEIQDDKLNYWGYGAKDTYYFAPKAAYSSQARADREMKEMVKHFHAQNMEVLMDFYFQPGTNVCLMLDCLRHWVMDYHVDGFRVNTEVIPAVSLASDPVLSGIKLIATYWDPQMLKDAGIHTENSKLAEYNDGFMNDTRRFVKSDEGQVEAFYRRFYARPQGAHVINFLTHVNGFTMMDLVSYDIKHNESNGERNTDGTEFNYSWNCGVEGKTRKKTVLDQRMRQIRNGFLLLFCSQGTPMLLAGDEFGNSQNGNNNPYCHDDTITWLNWKETCRGAQIREYVKKLIVFRKLHPVLHQERALRLIDTLSCGIPDLSAHGLQTWRPDFSNYSRMLGVLLCGAYAKDAVGKEDASIYIACNMYWEAKSFDLPTLPSGAKWYPAIETYEEKFYEMPEEVQQDVKPRIRKLGVQQKVEMQPRSICVFVSGEVSEMSKR